ncbi:DNA cytosine methyltransferase [Pseudomonas gregormendelii]
MEITYGSVCSGIEAATLAWKPLGMRATWFAEIEAFPSAVLAHHYPDVPNHGDMTKLAALVLAGKIQAPDVLVGGTPCQAFSVAGMREGLTDARGALTIKYVELADAVDYVRAGQRKPASVIVWENVPGVLSDKGNAFGCFLGALAGEDCELQPPGKKWQDAGCVYGPKRTIAWRVLDAQYFGLAQRRRRVFVVASARDGFDPTEVLFEREGVRRDTAPRRGEGSDVTGTAPFGPALQCGCGCVFGEELGPYGCMNCEGDEGPAASMFGGIPAFGAGTVSGSIERSGTLTSHEGRQDFDSETFFVQERPVNALTANGVGTCGADDNQAQAGHLIAFSCKDHGADAGEISPTLRAMNHSGSHANAGGQVAVCITGDITHMLKAEGFDGSEDSTGRGQPIIAAFAENSRAELRYEDGDGGIAGTLSGGGGKAGQGMPSAQVGSSVRRLIPRECERLQGFPDDYTRIPWRGRVFGLCPDGPRYKAIGNSKAVTVVRWIGCRLLQQL